MNWNHITTPEDLDNIVKLSEKHPVLIFKHSSRCSISSMALNRLEKSWKDDNHITPYFLDLIQYRDLSSKISTDFNVHHESPQAILIKHGSAFFDCSHMDISFKHITEACQ